MRARILSIQALVIATIALSAFGLPTASSEESDGTIKAGCSGTFATGEVATCEFTFDSTDEVYVAGSSFARVQSAAATGWRVEGVLLDGAGEPYSAWYCAAKASALPAGKGALLFSSCGGNGFFSPHGNSPPHPGTHTARITAKADFCLEGTVDLCTFDAWTKVRPGAR